MAEVKISELPVGGDLEFGDVVPVVREGVTYQCQRSQLIKSLSVGVHMFIDASDPENLVIDSKAIIPIMFNEPGTLTNGEEMRLGNTEGQNNEGYVSPYTGKLVRLAISRGNSDPADIDISVNGVVQATVNSTTLKSVEVIDVSVTEADSIMVLGGASSPNNMIQPVVTLILEEN